MADSGRTRCRGAGALVAVTVAAALAVGCARSAPGSSASAPAADRALSAPAPALEAGSPPAPAGKAEGASLRVDALAEPAAEEGVAFISTATLTIDVDDVAGVKPKVIAVAQGAGGRLFGEESSYGARSRAVITLKVPPARFTGVLQELAALGTLATQQVKTDDVTQQVIDLDARISAATASLERTRDLLGQARSLTEVAQLENEVSRRQGDLESLKGQQKTLKGRIDMATIVVTLDGAGDATPANVPAEPAALPGFMDGLRGGWGVALSAATVVAAVLGALVPFLPLVVLVVLGLRYLRRRPSRSAPPPSGPALTTTTP